MGEIVKSSKPIEKLKKGDKIVIDGHALEVDDQVLLLDHKVTKEMAIEAFEPKSEREFQIRYFTDRLDVTAPELYELVGEIQYIKREYKKLEW